MPCRGCVRKLPVPCVAEQPVGSDCGNEQVRIAITVGISGRTAGAVGGVCYPGSPGDVRKRAVAEVAEEMVDGSWIRRIACQLGTVEQVEIKVAVGVEVEERGAGPHCLRVEVVSAGAVEVGEHQTGLLRDIDEADRLFINVLAAC